MPGSVSIPPHLIQYVASPANTVESASEALEEWIITRRGKGDTLFEVSVGLAELEDRTPPHCGVAFSRARYIANVPPPSDLTPPMGPFPLSRSASPVTILHHLLSQPPPSVEHSREVILEYVLSREAKLRDKKPGRGGKGTLGREGFEDVARKLAEIEDGLKLPGIDAMQLSTNRQTGLALILSLRMSLSYFTSVELGFQLLKLHTPDAERVITQHIRKRVEGEGRYGVGQELEQLEDMTVRRAALRPAFRSARARTTLPERPTYRIALPAPSKSGCIKLITSFVRDVDAGIQPSVGIASPAGDKSYFSTGPSSGSPSTPYTPLPLGTSSRRPLADPNPIANFVFELVCEFITREKREYMLKCKWAIKGREALSKDLSEIESATCLGKGGASPHAGELIPIFLVLRRSHNLPKSSLPISIIEPYLDLVPAPPDEDSIPYREPSVANTTAKLYVNPRLDDTAAYEVLEELLDSERELVAESEADDAKKAEYLTEQVDLIQKRFPDGSYEAVFAQIKGLIANPVTAQAMLKPPPVERQPSMHRRALSSAASGNLQKDALDTDRLPAPQSLERRLSHNRSASMPSRQSTFDPPAQAIDLNSDSEEEMAPTPSSVAIPKPILPPLSTNSGPYTNQYLSPGAVSGDRSSTGSAGWWDVISAVDNDHRSSQPWRSPSTPARLELSLPPGAEAARAPELASPLDENFNKLDLDFSASPDSPERSHFPMAESSPARRAMTRAVSSAPGSPGGGGSPRAAAPVYRPPPVPIKFDRPSFPSPTLPSSALPASPPERSPPVVKSKLGTFGRSLSIASKTMLARSKEKEREKEALREEREKLEVEREGDKENEKVAAMRRDKVNNSPGRWNKDMVANIMGPPVDRK